MKTSKDNPIDYCMKVRPLRKVICQLKKGHKGSCSAVIFWESDNPKKKLSTRE